MATAMVTRDNVGTIGNTDQLWDGLLARDRRLDRIFVYGVRSTGVYCRPSCPSRRPRREQVAFFTGPDDAEKAGFRACRRCHPRQNGNDPQSQLVRQVCAAIDGDLDQQPSLERLGRQFGLSPFHLQRTFKQAIGISPRQYAEMRRILTLKSALRAGSDVTTAMYDAGFGSSSRLYERAAEHLGMTPATYRRGGEGAHIRYGTAPCSLGRMLVASTKRGLCAVRFGEWEKALVAELQREFPKAEIEHDPTSLAPAVQKIAQYLSGEDEKLDLPLDIRATAFQRKVWEALRNIPRGETRSYGEIAKAIGSPRAMRAVGNACGANPVAVVIPCHRVTRGGGDLGGYRWGVERKEKLLRMENAQD